MATTTVEIEYALQTHAYAFTRRDRLKRLSRLVPHGKNLIDAKIMIRTDEINGFEEIGKIKDEYENTIETDKLGHVFEFRVAGVTKAGGQFIGLDIISPEIMLSTEK